MADAIPNRGSALAAVDYFFCILAFCTLVMRCGVRLFMVRRFGADDWTMLLAGVFFILYTTCSISGVHYGTGRHRWDLEPADYAQAKEYWWFCYLTYCWSMIMSKASIGLFLLRVAVRRMHIWIIYAAMSITFITCLAFFLVTIFQCHPISYFWDDYTQSGTCVPGKVITGLGYLYSICSIFTDFTFALLPGWIIWNLKMKTRTKLALIPLMAMGCVASSAVIVRCVYLTKFEDPDFLWATVDIAIWSSVEQGLAISAGSLATLRPLIKLIGYRLGMTSKPTNYAQYGPTGASGQTPSGQYLHRRRRSQSAVDALKLQDLSSPTQSQSRGNNSPHQTTRSAKGGGACAGAYEVRIETGAGGGGGGGQASPFGGISHGRTYEVRSEYVSPVVEKHRRLSSQLQMGTSSAWDRKGGGDSESIEELQPGTSSGDSIEADTRPEPKSF
ncbi:hypothetical protein GGR56DRAFT_663724 [Xylariaceae sp. FL0804]|nr:hypothetical protein GGR56DRAFT_663724 [Xylariaceae sp. FL0804]